MDFTGQNPPPSPPPSTAAKSPVLPWKTRLYIFFSTLYFDLTTRSDGTVNRRLGRLFDLKVAANPVKPIDGVISFDVTVDPTRNLSVRVFSPAAAAAAADSLPIIVYFHGGGFALFSNASYGYVTLCRRLARCIPAVIVSVEYRLSPEHRFPAQYDDGFDVLRFLDDNTVGLLPAAADLSHCFLAGDSSGANLAHHVAVRFARQKSQFLRLNVIGLLSIQPFFGGIERTESEIELDSGLVLSIAKMDWMWKAFLPEGSDRSHCAADVTAAEMSDLEDFPATAVVVGGFDLLKDRQRRYYEWLKESGMKVDLIEFPNMVHSFYIFPELPETSIMINHLKDFILKCREI